MANETSYKETLEALGFDLTELSNNQVVSTCPFCEKEGKFYVNKNTGLFDCKVCEISGNFTTLLRKIYDSCPDPAEDTAHFKALSDLAFRKGFTTETLCKYGFRKFTFAGKWLLPILNLDGNLVNFRLLTSPTFKCMAVKGMPLSIGFLPLLKKSKIVFVCEGEWDAIAMLELILEEKIDATVVSLPGAGVFKKEWFPLFKGKTVVLCYDNDRAGRHATEKASKSLTGIAEQVFALGWQDEDDDGKDLRDLIQKDEFDFERINDFLIEIRLDIGEEPVFSQESAQESFPHVSEVVNRDFTLCVEECKKHLLWDPDMELGLKFLCATNISLNFKTDAPLWGYLVGPPSSGKTALIMGFDGITNSTVESYVSPKGWVSGFTMPGKGDPSMMKKFLGKAVYFKDWTAHLTLSSDDKKEVDSILRDAYEGKVDRSFGNGVSRHYRGTFVLVGGVTSEIYADMDTELGARTLMCPIYLKGIPNEVEKEKGRRAFSNKQNYQGVNNGLKEAIAHLCCVRFDYSEVPKIPDYYLEGLIAWAQIVAHLRAKAKREKYQRDNLMYAIERELCPRLTTQLCQLFQAFGCLRHDLMPIEEDFFDVAKVAEASCRPFVFDIVKYLFQNGKAERKEIAEALSLKAANIEYVVEDMVAVNVLVKEQEESEEDDKKFKPYLYSLSPSFSKLCDEACMTEYLENEVERQKRYNVAI